MKNKLLVSVGVGFAALLSSVNGWASDQGQVCVSTAGGAWQDAMRQAIFKPFEKATGIKVVEAVQQPLSKVRAMVATGNPECDVLELVAPDFLQLSKEGLLAKIDYDSIDKKIIADFPGSAVTPYGVGTFVYATVIAFNTHHYTRANGPKSWVDVWDVKKFPGPRIVHAGNFVVAPIEAALLADGVQPNNLYPVDFKRAYSSLTRIKSNVVKWSTTGAMAPEALISGEAFIGTAALGRIQQAKEQGAPVDFVWDQALFINGYWGIVKGAKNYKNALKFIEFASQPKSQADFVKLQIAGPLNKHAFDFVSQDRAKLLPTYPANMAQAINSNSWWWAETDASGKSNLDKNNAMWSAWILQ